MLIEKSASHCSCQSCQLTLDRTTSQPAKLCFPPAALAGVSFQLFPLMMTSYLIFPTSIQRPFFSRIQASGFENKSRLQATG